MLAGSHKLTEAYLCTLYLFVLPKHFLNSTLEAKAASPLGHALYMACAILAVWVRLFDNVGLRVCSKLPQACTVWKALTALDCVGSILEQATRVAMTSIIVVLCNVSVGCSGR